uniref:UBX domain-containing protein n=1 Tax=Biomphalaria glabrata TaxID=6526 RepID=A0A2C9K5F4_BIOGL
MSCGLAPKWAAEWVNLKVSLQLILQGVFLFTLSTLLLGWLLPKIYLLLLCAIHSLAKAKHEKDDLELYESKKKEHREKSQTQYDSLASEYNQRVLIPRQEEKRRKKEEDFIKFLGPAWKGKGSPLGGQIFDDENHCDSAGQEAARRRIVREDINLDVLAAAASNAAKKQKIKHVIILPDEPSADEPDAISVLFRTPLGTTFQRRFLNSDKVQCLCDLITTKGFSYKSYIISTSYPRVLLSDPNVTLSELKFGKRILLNIEEKDAE